MIDNYIRVGYKHPLHNLIFTPFEGHSEPLFRKLKEKYKWHPQIQFFFYDGDSALQADSSNCDYIPLLRPYCLEKHFQLHPHLQQEPIFYHDSDILWTKKLDFGPFIEDDVNYMSLANSYLDYDYLISKFDHSIPERKHELLTLQPIEHLLSAFGIDVALIKENKFNTGGAQSLLKNITPEFWRRVYNGSIYIRSYFKILNQQFFPGDTPEEKENNGWQSWALADMCSLLWNLWKDGKATKCPPEFNFSWATSELQTLRENYIYHNAGVTADIVVEPDGKKTFYSFKGRQGYVKGYSSPHQEMERLVDVSSTKCSWWYVQQLLKVNDPIF